ncbi:MAG: ankyrin repeat domain-containing protein, partial [Gemmatimonadota bacterium]
MSLRAATILGLSLLLGAAAPFATTVETPVADAAQANDAAQVRTLLQQGADVNAPQPDGLTALHWAALNDSQEIVDVLLYAGASLEPLTRVGGYTPLHLAARSGHASIVRLLLERGAEADPWTSTGVTALHFAAQANDAESVRALVAHGADINAPDGFQSRTPLVFAASDNATAAVRTLLELGADPSITTALKDYVAIAERDDEERAKRASVRAAQAGEKPEVEPEAEPEGNEPPDSTEAEPATEPTAEEEPEEESAEPAEPPVQALSSEEQIGVQGGFAPLHYAARQGHMETVRLLLDEGADINHPSGDQSSPLLVAVINGNYDLAMMLLERGADPNLVSDDGAGPLFATLNIEWSLRTWYPQPQMFRVQETSYLDLMKALLEAGAEPNQRTTTHIWYAAYNAGRMGVDFTGATPFWRAAYATDVTAMRLLVEYGADPNIWTTKLPDRRRSEYPQEEEEEEEEDPSGLPPVEVGGP